MKVNNYSKSPLNYIGGKYKMLPQIFELFPTKINTMYDLFAGGCDVCANIQANTIYANDINKYVIDIYKEFQKLNITELLDYIDTTINQWGLSKTNKDAFLDFREYYNNCKFRNPLDLYILVCYSFNYQVRFNNSHDYNCPFGKDRSWFNPTMRKNLIQFHSNIKEIRFMSNDFKDIDLDFLKEEDFLYADPPYLITTGSYNDGKRGFNGWSQQDDIALFLLLDKLNEKDVKFALSNVIEHKGIKNDVLIEWAKKYSMHVIDYNYNNSNYHTKNTDKITTEVLITNY